MLDMQIRQEATLCVAFPMCNPAYGTCRHDMSPGLRENKTESFMYAHKPDCNGRFMRFFIRIKISGGDYMKKRILALLLVIAMAVLMLSACGEKEKPGRITADNLPKGKVLLSSLSNEELYKFITEHGATIPEECADMDFKSVIAFLENDIYNIDELRISYENARIKLIKEINDIVREYYGYPTFYNRETSEK